MEITLTNRQLVSVVQAMAPLASCGELGITVRWAIAKLMKELSGTHDLLAKAEFELTKSYAVMTEDGGFKPRVVAGAAVPNSWLFADPTKAPEFAAKHAELYAQTSTVKLDALIKLADLAPSKATPTDLLALEQFLQV